MIEEVTKRHIDLLETRKTRFKAMNECAKALESAVLNLPSPGNMKESIEKYKIFLSRTEAFADSIMAVYSVVNDETRIIGELLLAITEEFDR